MLGLVSASMPRFYVHFIDWTQILTPAWRAFGFYFKIYESLWGNAVLLLNFLLSLKSVVNQFLLNYLYFSFPLAGIILVLLLHLLPAAGH